MLAGTQIQAMLGDAVRLHQSGQMQRAVQLYQRVLSLDPQQPDALHLMGLALIQSGQPERALEPLHKATAIKGRMPAYHFHLALAQQMLGMLDEAEQGYRRVLMLKPGDGEAYTNLGNVLSAKGRTDEAVTCYRKAMAAEPGNAAAINNLGNVLQNRGDLDEAETLFRKALALAPMEADIHCNLGNVMRATGRLDEAIASFKAALAINPTHNPATNSLGLAYWMMGQREEALIWYRKALSLNPDSPEALTNLGLGLREMSRLDEAEKYLSRAATLKNDPAMLNNLASLLYAMGRPVEAMSWLGRSLALDEHPDTKRLFVNMAKRGGWTANNEALRPILVRALTEPWDRPGKLSASSAELIKKSPVIGGMVARANQAWPQRPAIDELLLGGGLSTLVDDALLMALLSTAPNCDLELERFLTLVRGALLEIALAGSNDDNVLRFAGALARQCFINEYVFLPAPNEAEKAKAMIAGLSTTSSPLMVLIAACYQPLKNAPALPRGCWPAEVEAVLVQQVDDPAQEKRLAMEIPRLTRIENDISRLVQDQYEENPYPRWAQLAGSGAPDDVLPFLMQKFPGAHFDQQSERVPKDILVAGCGTGQHSIARAQKFPNAAVTAVDLSLASLAYAKRKSQELGVSRIRYGQADVLELPSLGQKFDVIESIGVLHHMADPFAGWRALLNMLQPRGFMWLGFYSRRARVSVTATRAVIAMRALGTSPDAIRKFRQELFDQNEDGSLNPIVLSDDFFSISGCRDLLFHAQEHPVSLQEIADFLKENNLTFLGFELEDMVMQTYRNRFPDDLGATDLNKWTQFEEANPGIFAAMYVFWVQKRE